MNKRTLAAGVALALGCMLAACGEQQPEPQPEPVVEEAPELTEDEISAYRQRLEEATSKNIAHIVFAAPNEELRAEARERMRELNQPD